MANGDFIINGGVLTKYVGAGGNVVIPDGVTEIGEFAFDKCETLISVTIPSSVKKIIFHAFRKCVNLSSVTLPTTEIEICNSAFVGCKKLNSVTVTRFNTKLAYGAFDKRCIVVWQDASAAKTASSNYGRTTTSTASKPTPAASTPKTASSTAAKNPSKPSTKSSSASKTNAATNSNSAVKTSGSSSSAKTSTAPRTTSAPARSGSTASSGNDFLSQVRQNAIENSPENVLRRRDEAEARAQDKIRRDTESAISIEYVGVVKKEVLHYAPYYWYTNQNGQCECAGEIVLSCSGSSTWRDDFKSLYAWIGPYPSVSVNWYGEPRMNKNEMPYFKRPPILDYYEEKAQGERLELIRKVFNPSVECIKQDYGVLFKKYDISYVLHGETLFEKIFLRKLKDALGSAVSIVPCAPEIQATHPSPPTRYRFHDLKMNRVYKFKFVF